MKNFVGILKEVEEGNYDHYYFKPITEKGYNLVESGALLPQYLPIAAYFISDIPFWGADKISWQLKGQTLYADRVIVNNKMATDITPDVVGDMIVECAIMMEVDVLRVKIEKHSPVSTSLQESDMSVVISDDDYTYFEIDIPKEAALRDEMYNKNLC